MTEHDVMQFISDRLRARFDVKQIVLFGSRATGKAGLDSDYDVLVVADSDIPFVERQGLALLALGKRDFSLDLPLYTPKEAERACCLKTKTDRNGVVASKLFLTERDVLTPP